MKITKKLLKNLIVEVLNETEEMMSVGTAEMFVRNMRPQNLFTETGYTPGSPYYQFDQIQKAMDLPRHPNTVKEEIAAMYKLLDSDQIKDEMRGQLEKVLLALMMRPE
tara:strand:+ start:195 stop:518 length:324 start_codon:yes stop_codon:yes gene_type:complete